MASTATQSLDELSGNELSSVIFVRDYIQLGFDGPLLTLILDPVVCSHDGVRTRADPLFYQKLVSLIGRRVLAAEVKAAECVLVTFDSGDAVRTSLRNEDRQFGPEAVTYRDSNGSLSVW